ncbi:MAG: sensor histidine kinase [Candidatus Flexifilum sp.]
MGETERYRFDEVRQIFHEIKGPLTGIKAQIDFASIISSEPQVQQKLQTVMSAIDRLSAMIDAYLNFASLNARDFPTSPVVVDSLIQAEIEALQPLAAQRGIQFKFRLPKQPVVTRASEQTLRSIVSNLLMNAVKYNRDGGTVTVSLQARKKTFRLSVRDQGSGIPERDQPYIFLPAYRGRSAKANADGFGLGLAFVKQRVEELGGRVWFETIVGEETTFFVALPIEIQQEAHEPQESTDGVYDFIQEGVDRHALSRDRDQSPAESSQA